jgi:formate hydrogenlyase subunit 3/multisubunit Na+/H+ antiporter MnhD subunit
MEKKIAYPIAITAYFIVAAATYLFMVYLCINKWNDKYFFGGWAPPIGIEYVYDPLVFICSMVINVVALIV